MTAQGDEDRPGREHVRALITASGVLLSCGALAALVLTDDPQELRLAVVAALWAFLLVAITGRFRRQDRTGGDDDDELRHFYQLELQQEVAARKEYELRLEVQLRRELENSRSSELTELRGELNRLRAELRGIEVPERALALLATRLSPETLRTLQEEGRRPGPHRPSEPLQLPAAGTPTPTPAPTSDQTVGSRTGESAYSAPASYAQPASYAPSGGESGVARGLDPHPTPARGTPEYLPAPRVGSAPGNDTGVDYAAASHASRSRPPFAQDPYQAAVDTRAEAYTLPADSYASSDSYPVPAHLLHARQSPVESPSVSSWSSYGSKEPEPTGSPAGPAPASRGAHSDTYSARESTPEIGSSEVGVPEPDRGAHSRPDEPVPWPEPFPSRGRHGTLSVESSRADPFDPSNTWPDAFRAKRPDFLNGSVDQQPYHAELPELPELPVARPAHAPDSYSHEPAADQPAAERPQRGRHHAEETGAYLPPANPSSTASSTTSSTTSSSDGGRPDDDVLAQILGRW